MEIKREPEDNLDYDDDMNAETDGGVTVKIEDQTSPQADKETAPRKKRGKRGGYAQKKAQYQGKCLTCEKPGHTWRDCQRVCAHHEREKGERITHGGQECPLVPSLYKKLGRGVLLPRGEFERRTNERAARAIADTEAAAREMERTSYQEGLVAGVEQEQQRFDSRVRAEQATASYPPPVEPAGYARPARPARSPPRQQQPGYREPECRGREYRECPAPARPARHPSLQRQSEYQAEGYETPDPRGAFGYQSTPAPAPTTPQYDYALPPASGVPSMAEYLLLAALRYDEQYRQPQGLPPPPPGRNQEPR